MSSSASLKLGTRGSRLALAQATMVRALLAERGVASEIIVIKTSGDRIQDRPLADVGGKGLFTKELEEALLARSVDFCVHSMKDVPTALPDGLMLAAILPREDPRDVLIGAASLDQLPKGARVGTSSVRRTAQLARLRPDLEIVPLRGNVDTRLSKLEAGSIDAIILALAGLKRLGLADRATAMLEIENWLPALAQGAVGIETRADDAVTNAAVTALNHEPTSIALTAERAFQAALDGSCRTPIAGLATLSGNVLSFKGEVIAPDGSAHLSAAFTVPLSVHAAKDVEKAGRDAGLSLRDRAAPWLTL